MRTRRQTLFDLLGLGVVGQDQGVQVALGSDLELDLLLLLGAAGDSNGGALDAGGWTFVLVFDSLVTFRAIFSLRCQDYIKYDRDS